MKPEDIITKPEVLKDTDYSWQELADIAQYYYRLCYVDDMLERLNFDDIFRTRLIDLVSEDGEMSQDEAVNMVINSPKFKEMAEFYAEDVRYSMYESDCADEELNETEQESLFYAIGKIILSDD